MQFFQILLLSFSLAADAFAVSVGTGISEKNIHRKNTLLMSGCFGFFQTIMPIIGFFLASLLSNFIGKYDHWIAFVLLGYIGGNMIHEGYKGDDEAVEIKNIFSFRSLLVLGIATSIDALAVGISLTATTANILFPAFMIGIITFILSYIGIGFGKKFGQHIGSRAEIIGGIILIGIGIKILIEHLFF